MLISQEQVSGRSAHTHHLWGKRQASAWTAIFGDSMRASVLSPGPCCPSIFGIQVAPDDTKKEAVL